MNRSVGAAVMIAVGAANLHAGNAEKEVFSAFKSGFDSRIVAQGASQTWHNYVDWWNKTQGTPLPGETELATNLWAEGVARLKPQYVYARGVHIVIVRSRDGDDEEGFHVGLHIASSDIPNREQFTRILIAHEVPYGIVFAFRRRGHFERTPAKDQKEMTPNKPSEATP